MTKSNLQKGEPVWLRVPKKEPIMPRKVTQLVTGAGTSVITFLSHTHRKFRKRTRGVLKL